MKKCLMVSYFLLIVLFCFAQAPVRWTYNAIRLDEQTYEIHLVAIVQDPWHIYSQFTPRGGPSPTKISIANNPLLTLRGSIKEVGKLNKKYEAVFGVDVHYFSSGKIEFIQQVKVRRTAKTNVTGTIEYMACTDDECLTPVTINFSVNLD